MLFPIATEEIYKHSYISTDKELTHKSWWKLHLGRRKSALAAMNLAVGMMTCQQEASVNKERPPMLT